MRKLLGRSCAEIEQNRAGHSAIRRFSQDVVPAIEFHRQSHRQPWGGSLPAVVAADTYSNLRDAIKVVQYPPGIANVGVLAVEKQPCRFTWASCARSATESTSSARPLESNRCQHRGCIQFAVNSAPKQKSSERKRCARTASQIRCSALVTQSKVSTFPFRCQRKTQARRRRISSVNPVLRSHLEPATGINLLSPFNSD